MLQNEPLGEYSFYDLLTTLSIAQRGLILRLVSNESEKM
jgi:hypothetical protein